MAASTMYATPTGAGSKNGTSWSDAFDLAALVTDLTNNSEAGDIYYLGPGTYTLSANLTVSGRNGTHAAPITVIGVEANTTTEATGNSRPLLSMGGYQATFSSEMWRLRGLRWSSTISNYCIRLYLSASIINCRIENTGDSSANTIGVVLGAHYVSIIDCEVTCPNGVGIYTAVGAYICRVLGCYVHDCITGVSATCQTFSMISTTIANCSTAGLSMPASTQAGVVLHGLTVVNCGTGILANLVTASSVTSCIIAYNTTGMAWTTAALTAIVEWCNFYGNGTDVSNVTKGATCTAIDPSFVDAEHGDFRVGSALIGAGFPGVMPGTAFSAPAVPGALQIVAPVLPSASVVEDQTPFGYRSALTGSYPTTATSKAEQLAADQLEVSGNKAKIQDGEVVLTGSDEGTYDPLSAAVWPDEENVLVKETAWGPTGAEYAGAFVCPTAEEVVAAIEASGSKLDALYDLTEEVESVRRFVSSAMEAWVPGAESLAAIAAGVLTTDIAGTIEAAAAEYSLCYVILANSQLDTTTELGKLTVFRSDGTTPFAAKPISTAPDLETITKIAST